MSAILDTAVERHPIVGHDGRTGATLERVVLADGTRLVVKHTSTEIDLVTRLTGEHAATGPLWASGVLRDLPPGVNSAVLDALLDWDLPTWAPPALEVAWWIAGGAATVTATREQILKDIRALYPGWHDENALNVALFAGLADFGWNKALDAAEHSDPAKRAREAADLAWWVARGRGALNAGVIG